MIGYSLPGVYNYIYGKPGWDSCAFSGGLIVKLGLSVMALLNTIDGDENDDDIAVLFPIITKYLSRFGKSPISLWIAI